MFAVVSFTFCLLVAAHVRGEHIYFQAHAEGWYMCLEDNKTDKFIYVKLMNIGARPIQLTTTIAATTSIPTTTTTITTVGQTTATVGQMNSTTGQANTTKGQEVSAGGVTSGPGIVQSLEGTEPESDTYLVNLMFIVLSMAATVFVVMAIKYRRLVNYKELSYRSVRTNNRTKSHAATGKNSTTSTGEANYPSGFKGVGAAKSSVRVVGGIIPSYRQQSYPLISNKPVSYTTRASTQSIGGPAATITTAPASYPTTAVSTPVHIVNEMEEISLKPSNRKKSVFEKYYDMYVTK